MTRRTPTSATRRLTAALSGVLLIGALAACGEETSAEVDNGPTTGDLSAVSISGDFGEEPKVDWKEGLDVDKLDAETLIEGDGAEIGAEDKVLARLYVGNGYTKTTAYSSFAEGAPPELLPAPSELSAGLKAAVEGHTLGSRVAVAAGPDDAFGEMGNPQLGVGNADSVLFVVDLLSTLPSSPSGKEAEPAAWAPALKGGEDKPTGFDFAGTPEPTDKLRSTFLIEGDGPVTEKGQTVYVNYVGQVYEGKKPFDSSFDKGEPFNFTLGEGQVIKGWDRGFTGVPVGSRIIISVPPKLGYGEQGNEQAGIKGTDTLFFAVDVLAAM